MIKSLVRSSLRALVNQRPYSYINITGLAIGLSAVLLIIIWISVETSFDKFHKDPDRIFRVAHLMKTPNRDFNMGSIYAPAGPEFKRTFPVIEKAVRVNPYPESAIYNDKTYNLKIFYSDKEFFDLFSFDLKSGDKRTCLESPSGIVITEKTAGKIFGPDDPLGKTILVSGNALTVSAVAKNPPVNTNMQFDCIAPLSIKEKVEHVGWDGGMTCYTYLKLVNGTDPRILEKQILDYLENIINKRYREYGYAIIPYLQNIGEIHLDSKAEFDMGEKGSRSRVYLFTGIGLLILLIACFNFVNISTALSFTRTKEVCIKKTFGSDRINIILAFVSESFTGIMISFLSAFILLWAILPSASAMVGIDLTISSVRLSEWIIITLSLFIFCMIFASFYSSFYLSSINPLALLNEVNRGKRKQYSRNALVTFQYTISIALIICCLVIYSQMRFVKNYNLGFNYKNILVINFNQKTSATYELIREKISSLPGVISVSVSSGGAPGLGFTSNGYLPEGIDKPIMANAVYIDNNYLKTMGISLLDGRDFRNSKADSNKVIINQTFAKFMGWGNPIDKTITRNIKYEVIGVTKDFSTSSIHNKIEPIFITTVNEWGQFNNIMVKYQPSTLSALLKSSEKIMKDIDRQYPFEYNILEDSIFSGYSREHKMNTLFLILSAISILISSLGLYGLATFSTQSRMKEISIRKINGATINDILLKFNSDLLSWILISFLIAAPIGYYMMNKWLGNFAYKISIGPGILILSGFFALVIGLLTVCWATFKSAKSNPAVTIRKE